MLTLLAGLLLLPSSIPPLKVVDTQKATIDNQRWEVVIYAGFLDPTSYCYKIFRNGKLIKKKGDGTEQEGYLWGARFLSWPYKGKLLAIARHSGCGHGMNTWFYTIHQGKLRGPLFQLQCEIGGPIYKDLDRDGRPELLFDNYDYYTHRDKGPDAFHAFKVLKDGRIKFWKVLPNPKRQHLKFKLPYF